MKTSYIIFGLAMGMAVASCSQFDLPNPTGQENPQLPGFASDGLAIEQAAQTLDLPAARDAGTPVVLAHITKLTDFPADEYTLAFEMDIATTPDFADAATVPVDVNDKDIDIEAGALNSAISTNFTKDPADVTLYARFAAYATRGENTKIRLGGSDSYFYGTDYQYLVIRFAPEHAIEDEYYLVGSFCGWDITKAVAMERDDEKSVYDNPVFTLDVDVTADDVADGGYQWKIISGTTYHAAQWSDAAGSQYGPAAADELVGTLVATSGAAAEGAGVITTASPYKVTVNMEDLTYSFKAALLYTPGDSNGWDQATSQTLTTSDSKNYSGYAHLKGSFKLSAQPGWDGINYGIADEAVVKKDDKGNIISITGHLDTAVDAKNLSVPADGLYYLEVNVVELTYTIIPVRTYGVIGDATPAGWGASTPLTPSADFLVWSATMELGTGVLKFRANDEWAINLGGEPDNLTAGGADMPSPGAGTYSVTLDLSKHPYTATFAKK